MGRAKYLYGDWPARKANFCLVRSPDREILPIPGLAFDVRLPDLEAIRIRRPSDRAGPNTVVGIGDTFHRHARRSTPSRAPHRGGPWVRMG
jgi:hypothetical protein